MARGSIVLASVCKATGRESIIASKGWCCHRRWMVYCVWNARGRERVKKGKGIEDVEGRGGTRGTMRRRRRNEDGNGEGREWQR